MGVAVGNWDGVGADVGFAVIVGVGVFGAELAVIVGIVVLGLGVAVVCGT